jgi:hypothetical protein
MLRYKGRSNAKAIERDFPHIVEMAALGDIAIEWHRITKDS